MEKIHFFLLTFSFIGLLDEVFYHHFKYDLIHNPNSLKENILHIARYVTYFFIFNLVAHFEMYGIYTYIMLGLVLVDVIIGLLDIWVEPQSRENIGGLSKEEYLIHMLLSFNFGGFLYFYIPLLFSRLAMPSEIVFLGPDLNWVRILFSTMSFGSIVMTIRGIVILKKQKLNCVSLS